MESAQESDTVVSLELVADMAEFQELYMAFAQEFDKESALESGMGWNHQFLYHKPSHMLYRKEAWRFQER